MSFLCTQLKREKITPKHCVEVGVHYPETSNILDFINEGIRTDLVEPDPNCMQQIKQKFKNHPNVTFHEVAIYDTRKDLKLYRFKASTFVSELSSSPALVNDSYVPSEKDTFIAKGIPLSDIDDGSIDLLSVDTEGCEWHVLQTLRSRPTIISLETHSGGVYTNPNLEKIKTWMEENKYKLWYKDHSDSVYLQKNIPVSFKTTYGWQIERVCILKRKIINRLKKLAS